MSKVQLLVVMVLLVSAAVLSTIGLVRTRETQHTLPPPPKMAVDKSENKAMGAPDVSSSEVASRAQALSEKNLFVPGRGPRVEDPEADAPGPETPSDLELTGIGRIGDRQAAIIIVNARRRSHSSRSRRTAPQTKEPPKKKIFKIGDAVADTGLTLAKINFDKQEGICEVELTESGGGTRILKMETDDKASQTRSSQASRAEVKTAQINIPKTSKTSTRNISTLPPPPPGMTKNNTRTPGTPPTPNVLSKTNTGKTSTKPLSQMSREERLKEVLRLRQERLKASSAAGNK